MSSTTLQMPAITSEQLMETLPSLFGPFTVLSVGSEPNLAQQSLDLGSPFHGRGLGFHRYSRWLFTYRMNSLNREHLLTNNTLISKYYYRLSINTEHNDCMFFASVDCVAS